MNKTIKDLELKANQIRRDVLDVVYASKAGHIGGSLSSTDILTTLYYNVLNINAENIKDPDRDRFILSKGHIAESLYCILGIKVFLIRKS